MRLSLLFVALEDTVIFFIYSSLSVCKIAY